MTAQTLVDEVLETRRLLARGRDIRLCADVTQERMAAEIPVDRTTLGRWEAGTALPSGRARARYLEVLRSLELALAAEEA